MRVRVILVLLVCGAVPLFLAVGNPGSPDEPEAPGETPASTDPDSPPLETPPGVPDPESEESGPAIVGRVVDDARHPVAGVTVSLHGAGERPRVANTGPDGTCRFDGVAIEGTGPLALHAVAPDGRCGLSWIYLPKVISDLVRAPAIVLGAGNKIVVRVVSDGEPVPGARVFARLSLSGTLIPAPLTDAAGGTTLLLPPGRFVLQAFAAEPERRGDVAIGKPLPGPEEPVVIEVRPVRDVAVLVVERDGGAPVPGAVVEYYRVWRDPGPFAVGMVRELPLAPTDEKGLTYIRGTDPEDRFVVFRARAPGGRAVSRANLPVAPGQDEVRVELGPSRTIRFPVVAGEAPVPPDGATIRLRLEFGAEGLPPPEQGRMEGRFLVVPEVPEGAFHAIAVAPDGSLASLWATADALEGRETSFRPARTVEVLLTEEGGGPAAGLLVVLRSQGNSPVAEIVETDPEGRAVFPGLNDRRVEVWLVPNRKSPFGGQSLGTLDLGKGSGRIEAVVGRELEVVLRLTVDGERRLPRGFFVIPGFGGTPVQEFEEDPEAAEIRFRHRPEPGREKLHVEVRAAPLLTARGAFPVPPDGPVTGEIALSSGGTFHARIHPPTDGRFRLTVETRTPDDTAWMWSPDSPGMGVQPDPNGTARVGPVRAGRYRLLDGLSGAASAPVDVVPDGPERFLEFDLSRSGWVTGLVTLPEGTKPEDVRVVVEGDGLVRKTDGDAHAIRADGTFRIRVPGDRPVTIRPWHPSLEPAREGGTATLTAPREDVRLALVAGRQATFRIPPMPKLARSGGRSVRVLLFPGAVEGKPAFDLTAEYAPDGLCRFGSFRAGTYTLWIDVPKHAPAVIEGANLGDGVTDLGALKLRKGSTIRVRVLVKEGQDAPRIGLWAHHLDAPKYSRGTSSRGEAEIVLEGLGPGRFRVIGTPILTGVPGLLKEVVLDGVADLDLTMDLR